MKVSEIIHAIVSARSLILVPPHPEQISWADLSITDTIVKKVINIIQKHIQNSHKIAIYGDYDVDGLCATAILWQTIYANYKHVFPHIPDRRSEGYGLSEKGLDHCLSQGAKLVITVDSGIVAHDQIAYAKRKGLDVIVIDHHEKSDTLPSADGFIHSTRTSAAGLSYFLAREITKYLPSPELRRGVGGEVEANDAISSRVRGEVDKESDNNLDLTALAIICDLVPLTGINRSLAKFGLQTLSHTSRPGLLALFKESGLLSNQVTNNHLTITPYHVGFILGPRLNATGRLTHALDSLRLLCTNNPEKATELAKTLNEINIKRQQLTESLTQHAITSVENNSPSPEIRRGARGEVLGEIGNILVVADPSYDEGVIGLIAAKLVEKYYCPAIAISVGDEICKASARSIPGFHITDFLRQHQDLFLGVGGHSMAAGFSLSTKNLTSILHLLSSAVISPELLIKKDKFDLELNLADCSWDLFLGICSLEPFGLGNPTPVFIAKNVQISNVQTFGKTTQHLKFIASQNGVSMSCVWFNPPNLINIPNLTNLYYQLDADTYRGPGNIQLIVKNIVNKKD